MINIIFLFSFLAGADDQQIYKGVAKDVKDSVSYQENHKVNFINKKVQSVQTEYTNKEGKVFAELSSDFKKNLNVPSYHFKDFRNGSSHGITSDGENYIVWRQYKDKEREEEKFKKSEFDKSTLVVGCQGLHYYLVDNLQLIREKKKIPIKYLIPGNLDYVSFTLSIKSEDEENIYLTVSVDSIFLKLFVSSLELKYRKSDLKLIEYSGLSNILDESGDIQKVKIDYTYSEEKL